MYPKPGALRNALPTSEKPQTFEAAGTPERDHTAAIVGARFERTPCEDTKTGSSLVRFISSFVTLLGLSNAKRALSAAACLLVRFHDALACPSIRKVVEGISFGSSGGMCCARRLPSRIRNAVASLVTAGCDRRSDCEFQPGRSFGCASDCNAATSRTPTALLRRVLRDVPERFLIQRPNALHLEASACDVLPAHVLPQTPPTRGARRGRVLDARLSRRWRTGGPFRSR